MPPPITYDTVQPELLFPVSDTTDYTKRSSNLVGGGMPPALRLCV